MSCNFEPFLPADCGSDLCCDGVIWYADLDYRWQKSNTSFSSCSGMEHFSSLHDLASCGRYLKFLSWVCPCCCGFWTCHSKVSYPRSSIWFLIENKDDKWNTHIKKGVGTLTMNFHHRRKNLVPTGFVVFI